MYYLFVVSERCFRRKFAHASHSLIFKKRSFLSFVHFDLGNYCVSGVLVFQQHWLNNSFFTVYGTRVYILILVITMLSES